jgi:hypothetical protein
MSKTAAAVTVITGTSALVCPPALETFVTKVETY